MYINSKGKSMKKAKGFAILTAASLALILVQPAKAIFGLGDIVFDPTSYATLGTIASSNASMVSKMIQEYNQLIKIYTTNMQMYSHAMMMAQRISHPQRTMWMTLAQQQVNDRTRNLYGETAQWPSMLNGQPNWAGAAWSNSTLSLRSNPNLSSETLGSSAALAHVATVEAIDGSAEKCLATIAQYRAGAQANVTAYAALQSSQLDDSDATNSEIQQLNLINASQAQAMNEARNQGAVHACLVEQQVLANKAQRDSSVAHMNFVADSERYAATEGNGWGGAAEALRAR